MSSLIQAIRSHLVRIIEDIDAGNSNLTEEEALAVMKAIARYSRKDTPMSKESACTYIGMSRSKFDSLVREGKIPRGKKSLGFKELHWTKRDLDKYLKSQK